MHLSLLLLFTLSAAPPFELRDKLHSLTYLHISAIKLIWLFICNELLFIDVEFRCVTNIIIFIFIFKIIVPLHNFYFIFAGNQQSFLSEIIALNSFPSWLAYKVLTPDGVVLVSVSSHIILCLPYPHILYFLDLQSEKSVIRTRVKTIIRTRERF